MAIRGAFFAPLYLLPEERFQSEFGALGIKEDGTDTVWHRKAGREVSIRRFGGCAAEVNEVLDGLA